MVTILIMIIITIILVVAIMWISSGCGIMQLIVPSLTIHPDSCCTMIVTWPTSSFPISRQAGLEEVQLLRHGLERHLRRYLTKDTGLLTMSASLLLLHPNFHHFKCGSTTHSNSHLLPSLKLNISPKNRPGPKRKLIDSNPIGFQGRKSCFRGGYLSHCGFKTVHVDLYRSLPESPSTFSGQDDIWLL